MMHLLAKIPDLGRLSLEPLRAGKLSLTALMVWALGAAYCHGYENLLTGAGNWPGSLLWSAIAVLPWFGIFEWSKRPAGQQFLNSFSRVFGLLVAIAAASIGLEFIVNWSIGDYTAPPALLLMRRMPAIAATLMLIELARKKRQRAAASPDDADLRALAGSIEYIAAADNYVELHLPTGVTLRRMTLAEAAVSLRSRGFVRVHRRFVVNLAHIEVIHPRSPAFVQLSSGAQIPVGHAYCRNIPEWR
ncbi:MAG: LytTR family DNA-binding domain-containing protein [Sphingomicrobium sp.]